MSKEISMESLYANGMGIELPISNVKDSSQTQESYPCSNIIDLQSIENDLMYREIFYSIDKKNSTEMLKLYDKLNKEYGKHSQALESYLDNKSDDVKRSMNTNEQSQESLVAYTVIIGVVMIVCFILGITEAAMIKKIIEELKNNNSIKSEIETFNKECEMIYSDIKKITQKTSSIKKLIKGDIKRLSVLSANENIKRFSVKMNFPLSYKIGKYNALSFLKNTIRREFYKDTGKLDAIYVPCIKIIPTSTLKTFQNADVIEKEIRKLHPKINEIIKKHIKSQTGVNCEMVFFDLIVFSTYNHGVKISERLDVTCDLEFKLKKNYSKLVSEIRKLGEKK